MSLETFEFVVDLVRENIQKYLTTFRDSIKVKNRVAIGIWRRATRNSYRTVSKVFGFGKSTVIKITADFVKASKISFAIDKISERKLRNCKCSSVI